MSLAGRKRHRTINKVKEAIRRTYKTADCGIYFTSNLVGDEMNTIFNQNGVIVQICPMYSYYEVFGLTDKEEKEIEAFYDKLTEQ